jgi:hypothetical protein
VGFVSVLGILTQFPLLDSCMALSDLVSQPRQVRNSCSLQPVVRLEKIIRSVLKSLIPIDESDTLPPNPSDGVSTRATVSVLQVGTSPQGKVSSPRRIPCWVNEVCQGGLHDHSPSVLLPWSAQECLDLEPEREQFLLWDDPTVVDNQRGDFTLVFSTLCSHGVELAVHGLPNDDQGVLDHGGGVTKDEVHSARNNTVTIELSVCLNVQCVLVPIHPAIVEYCHIRLDTESHSLVSFRSSSVAESH